MIHGGRALYGAALAFQGVLLAGLWDTPYRGNALFTAAVGVVCLVVTHQLIPSFAKTLQEKGFSGVDLNKLPPKLVADIRAGKKNALADARKTLPHVPEALGVVPAFVYILGGLCCYLAIADDRDVSIHYISGLLTIVIMTFLGFVDDVIDLRWRYKIVLPFIASLPMLIIYEGPTTIILPSFLRRVVPFPEYITAFTTGGPLVIELGFIYHLYMSSLTTFCSNAINIYAGINGLEAGQSLVINAFILAHNVIEIVAAKGETSSATDHHSLSFILSLIFFNVTIALFYYNRYPSKVFVGDTFTMLAGVHFGAVCVMGHFAKTLLLFFIPQGINFMLSIPQLLGIVFCPRHRVPHLNSETGKMEHSPNLTLINAWLWLWGPLTEKRLTQTLLLFQIACGVGGLAIRYSPLYQSVFQ